MPKYFPQQLNQFIFPPLKHKNFKFFTSSLLLYFHGNFYGKLHWMTERVWNQSRKTSIKSRLYSSWLPWAVDIKHLEILLEPGNAGKNKYPLTLLSLMFINYAMEE